MAGPDGSFKRQRLRGLVMQIEFVLSGTSALLCHNPQMVDPNCEWNRQIKAITGKRKKTEADNADIERLEWFGGLYTAEINGKVVVSQPSSKVRKCLINAARITKQGKEIERALIMTELNVPLIYDGSDVAGESDVEIQRLFTNSQFHSRLSVGIGKKRVMRVRPSFPRWAMIVPAVFVPDAGLNFEELVRITELAGVAERIGDNRVNGYGSFRGHVRAVTSQAKPIKASLAGVAAFFDSIERSRVA